MRRGTAVLWALAIVLGVGLIDGTPLPAQQIDLAEANAREEFRFGVQAYHAARFNDAIVAFTRALAFTPEDLRIREWLGRAYYRAGLEDAAVAEWNMLVDATAAGAYLLSRLDTLEYRRGVQPFVGENLSLARSQLIANAMGDTVLFRRPAGVAAEPDGDIFVVSLGTREVLRITPNGRIAQRYTGGLRGLDQPFDVAVVGDQLVVSEFGGDRVTLLTDTGTVARTMGSSGLGPGELLGPQYLAVDQRDGFVYVSEWGNRRVSKFGLDGEFLLTIGQPSPFFSGLQRPTGLAVASDGRLFVADADDEGVALHLFDGSGNHLRRIPLPVSGAEAAENSISGAVVEDLDWYDERRLLVSVGARTLVFDPATESVDAVIDDPGRERVVGAVRDANGRVVVSDFDADEVGIFEPEGSLYSGLDVQIERIIARDFPRIAMLVAVHDRDAQPVVGLTAENFIVSENGVPRTEITLDSSGQSVERLEMAVLLQPRNGDDYRRNAGQAAADLSAAIDGDDSMTLYTAGDPPQEILRGAASAERIAAVAETAVADRSQLFQTDTIRLDMSIRLAATALLDGGIRRHLVMVGDGRVSDSSFAEYGIEETAAFLANNGVTLHLLMVEQRTPDPEIAYLLEQTGGDARYLYEPEGVAPWVTGFRATPSGRYWIVVPAMSDPDFGRRYIELSVEARLFVRSGRDELGFFGPAAP